MVLIVGSYQVSVKKVRRRNGETSAADYLAAQKSHRWQELEKTLARERADQLARMICRL